MSKDIIDYLHFYLGCQVIGTYNDQSGSKGFLTGVTNGGHECEIQFLLEDGINVSEEPEYNLISEVKPILRKLESMTEEEMKELLIKWFHPNEDIFLQTIDETRFLRQEPNRHIKRGEGIGYNVFKNGKHKQTGTLSFTSLNAAQFHYLLSHGFWLFGNDWFDEGLIIDKETLKG